MKLAAITLVVSTALAAPALAGGTITFGYSAKNQDEANLMKLGMVAYELGKDHHKNGKITSQGAGAAAAILNPHGNAGIVDQYGNGHNGSMVLNGNGTKCMLVQGGNGASNHVNAAPGETCVVVGIGLD